MLYLNEICEFLQKHSQYEITCRTTRSILALRMTRLAVMQDFADVVDLTGKLEDFYVVGSSTWEGLWDSKTAHDTSVSDILEKMKRECDNMVEDEYNKTLEKLGFNEYM